MAVHKPPERGTQGAEGRIAQNTLFFSGIACR